MIKYQVQPFPNAGYLTAELDSDILLPIFSEIEEIQKNNFENAIPYNQNLIGNIEKEFELTKSKQYIAQSLHPLALKYNEYFNFSDPNDLYLRDVWVNFQKKYEFNPQHNHSGVISFVIWISIPYEINNEMLISPGKKSAKNVAGHFSFHYSDITGNICSHALPVDKEFENNIIMFPSKILHSVYPFYSSDEYRISIAGNFAN